VAPGFDFADFELARPHDLAPFASTLTALCGDWETLLAHG
jgi:predicted cupin superfamily sugar epimerase